MYNSQFQQRAFWIRLINYIKEERWTAIKHLSLRLFQTAIESLVILLIVPLILILRIIRPFIWIRFGEIRSDVIGHSVTDPEFYLSEREVEKFKTFDCFYFQTKKFPNEQWSKMVQEHLRINPLFRLFDKSNKLIYGGKLLQKATNVTSSRDPKGYLARTKPHFSFTNEENLTGLQFIESLGIVSRDQFICLIVRDSAYKEKYQNSNNRIDWSKHNYRDSDIDTYKEAALALVDKGYWIFRMGKVVNDAFMADHPHIIDYALSPHRSDFLDIWLMANCFFCISNSTGLDEVSVIFQKPLIKSNMLPFGLTNTYSNCITVPKHLIWKDTNKRLSLSEHLSHPHLRSDLYKKNKILIQELTSKEILQAVLEMESRLTGSLVDSDEDIQLQSLFWKMFKQWPKYKNYHGWIHPKARVGASFLKENPEWLK